MLRVTNGAARRASSQKLTWRLQKMRMSTIMARMIKTRDKRTRSMMREKMMMMGSRTATPIRLPKRSLKDTEILLKSQFMKKNWDKVSQIYSTGWSIRTH